MKEVTGRKCPFKPGQKMEDTELSAGADHMEWIQVKPEIAAKPMYAIRTQSKFLLVAFVFDWVGSAGLLAVVAE
jgi:hypothetical protein